MKSIDEAIQKANATSGPLHGADVARILQEANSGVDAVVKEWEDYATNTRLLSSHNKDARGKFKYVPVHVVDRIISKLKD